MSARQDPLDGMRADGKKNASAAGTASNGRLEAELWKTADALRGSMAVAEYKHVVLGLIFLKYISDAFEEYHAELETQIPVCLWFMARDKRNGRFRDRRNNVLFIDTRKLGEMEDRTHRKLTDDDIDRIADTYHAWRGEEDAIERRGEYVDVPGFCKSATLEEVRAHGHVLTPGRYVGAEAPEEDGEPFEEKMRRLTATLEEQFAEAARLEGEIRASLRSVGYDVGRKD